MLLNLKMEELINRNDLSVIWGSIFVHDTISSNCTCWTLNCRISINYQVTWSHIEHLMLYFSIIMFVLEDTHVYKLKLTNFLQLRVTKKKKKKWQVKSYTCICQPKKKKQKKTKKAQIAKTKR